MYFFIVGEIVISMRMLQSVNVCLCNAMSAKTAEIKPCSIYTYDIATLIFYP